MTQPDDYKEELSAPRTAAIAEGLGGVNCHKLAPVLRTFILEHMTKDNVGLYLPRWKVLEVLEPLDELEDFWPAFGDMEVLCSEVVSFWKLVVKASRGSTGGSSGDGGCGAAAAGTMGFRAQQRAADREPQDDDVSAQ